MTTNERASKIVQLVDEVQSVLKARIEDDPISDKVDQIKALAGGILESTEPGAGESPESSTETDGEKPEKTVATTGAADG